MELEFLTYETAVPSGVGTRVSPVWHCSAKAHWHSVHPKIITFSYMGASLGLMQLCVQEGVKLTFLTPTGRYIGSLEGSTRGNVLLRRTQYRIADDEPAAAHFAALFISAKIGQPAISSGSLPKRLPPDGERGRELSGGTQPTQDFAKELSLQARPYDRYGCRGLSGTAILCSLSPPHTATGVHLRGTVATTASR